MKELDRQAIRALRGEKELRICKWCKEEYDPGEFGSLEFCCEFCAKAYIS